MNDSLAEQTIVDHKYLLELVENRCAIAFYAVSSRNHSLYLALQRFYRYERKLKRDNDINNMAGNHDDLSGSTAPYGSERFLQ